MDDAQIQSIAVNLLTPFIARLLGWAGGILAGGAGITLTTSDASAEKIAALIVGLVFMVMHQLIASASNKSIARSGYQQGAAAAGMTLSDSELPKVVSGNAPVVSAPAPASVTSLGIKADAAGNITVNPGNTPTYK